MAILLDSFFNEQRGPRRFWHRRCGHLTSDDSLLELFEFAEGLRLRREWVQAKSIIHFDLTDPEYDLALGLGAQLVSSRELVQRAIRLTPRGFGRLIATDDLELLAQWVAYNRAKNR
jgi:hypothetical protein